MPHNDCSAYTDTPHTTFPDNAWSGVVGEYHDLICDTTEAPEELIWGAIIGVLSALASLCVRLRSGAGYVQPVLFICLLGATSRARKTTAMTDAVEIVLDPLRPRATQPGEPDPFEIVRGQGSGEGLLEVLADRPWWPPGVNRNAQPATIQTGRAALYLFDEYGAFMEKAARDQAGNFHGFHLQLFDSPAQMQLSTRSNRMTCTNARGTILAASTPDYLAKGLSEALVHSGFVNRYLFISGERTTPIPRRPPTDQHAQAALLTRIRAHMDALRGREMTVSHEADAVNSARYVADYHRVEESRLIEAATDRSPTLAMRLAMVLAFADGSPVITGAHMTAAWDVVQYSRSVVTRLLGLMKSKDFEQAERKLLRAAQKLAAENGGTFTRPELRARLRGSNGLTARAFTAVWDSVLAAEDIIPVAAAVQGAEPRFTIVTSTQE